MRSYMRSPDEATKCWLRVDDLLNRIDLTKFITKIGLALTVNPEQLPLYLNVQMEVKHVTLGHNVTLTLHEPLYVDLDDSDDFILSCVFDKIMKFLKHELSECFMFNSKRFWNDGLHP